MRRSESDARLPLLPGRGAAVVPPMPVGGLAKCGTATESGIIVDKVAMLLFRVSALLVGIGNARLLIDRVSDVRRVCPRTLRWPFRLQFPSFDAS